MTTINQEIDAVIAVVGKKEFLNMLLLPAAILVCSFFVGLFLNRLVQNRIDRHLDVDETTFKFVVVKALKGLPLSWCMGVGVYWMIKVMDLPGPIDQLLSYILFAIIILTITSVLARAVSGLIDIRIEKANIGAAKTTLLQTIMTGIIYGMGILIVLDRCGISVTPIITALGVGGMAVALGLQDTLANVFAGIFLIVSKQLNMDDVVKLSSGETGRVYDISWRYTTLRTVLGNMVVVPNSQLAKSTIVNYNLPEPNIMVTLQLGVGYESDLDKVERVTIEVAEEVMDRVDHQIEKDPFIRYTDFGDSAINFTVYLHTSNYMSQTQLKHEFIKAITKRYREEGINIPYPIQTVIGEKPPQ